jgi:lambda repressor-like predicted transcriptional regulator
MRKSKFTEAHIAQILAEHDAGALMEELSRRNDVHANTIRCGARKMSA